MEKLLLVDGSNLLFQMFYGMPSRIINKNGKPIQGTLGFVGALLKIIKEIQPSHICVLFDGEHDNPRKDILVEYKANRIDYSSMPKEDTPFSQLKDIYLALTLLNIPFKELEEYETDDFIAAYALKFQHSMMVYIASWDSDYFSLLNDHITIYRYKGKQSYYCTPDYLIKRYHILPKQYIFYKALVGDASDHILGIPKIGPITAAKIVSKYESIQDVFEKGKEEAYYKHLSGKQERLEKNYQLISFYSIKHLPFDIEELILPEIKLSTNQILVKLGLL